MYAAAFSGNDKEREAVYGSPYCESGITAPLVNGSYCTYNISILAPVVNCYFLPISPPISSINCSTTSISS